MSMKRMALVVAALALVAAACGGSSTSGGSGSDGGSGGPVVPGDIAAGATVYSGNCAACHAADLSGIDGLGKQLAPSEFVQSMTEDELAAFIIVGRTVDDPDNMTGVAMPARGGNPNLTDQDIQDAAAYLKAQQ